MDSRLPPSLKLRGTGRGNDKEGAGMTTKNEVFDDGIYNLAEGDYQILAG